VIVGLSMSLNAVMRDPSTGMTTGSVQVRRET